MEQGFRPYWHYYQRSRHKFVVPQILPNRNYFSMYSNDKLDEGQLIVTQVTTRIMAISFPDPNTVETVEEMVRQRHGNSAYFINLTEHEYFKESFGGRVSPWFFDWLSINSLTIWSNAVLSIFLDLVTINRAHPETLRV